MFGALLLAYLFSQFYRAFLAVVAADLMRDLGLDLAALGTLPAAWLVAFALAQIPVGLSLDRIGPRWSLMGGLALAALGALRLATAASQGEALVAMTLLGIGSAPVLMAGFYLIGRCYPAARFASLTSLLVGLGTLGDPLSGLPLAAAVSAFGWRATMGAMAVLTVGATLVVALVVRDPPPVAGEVALPAWRGYAALLATPPLWRLFPMILVSYASVIAIRGLWIAPYLGDVHGVGRAGQSLAATLMGFAIAGGSLLYAWVVRRVGSARRTVMGGMTLSALCFGLLLVVPAGAAIPATACLLATSLFGSVFALLMAHARTFFPARSLGAGVTLVNLVCMVGAGLGQWLSGQAVGAAAAAGLPPAALYARLFAGFALAIAAALAVYATSRPDRVGSA